MELAAALDLLSRNPSARLDIAEIALGFARDEYPDLDIEAQLAEIDTMAHEAGSFIRGDFPARVLGLCRYLFHEMGFHGNDRDYYDPRNSYLNVVLERRTGIPITLSAVAMAVGRRAGLQIDGVGLPGHFIVKAVEGGREIYIDCFHGGRILTLQECEVLVRQVTGMQFHASSLVMAALTLGAIVERMLGNLRRIYQQGEDHTRALRVMERLLQLNPFDAVLRRDLGISLVRTGEPVRAREHLRFYVALAGDAGDTVSIRRLLESIDAAL